MEKLFKLMEKLRSPGGCPWDQQQTHVSIAKDLLEESAELIEAIETQDDAAMLEELGDVLLQIVFHAHLAKERGVFEFKDIVQSISEKLIRRHPHVFGNTTVEGIDVVYEQWERIKKDEKSGTKMERHSALDGNPIHMPALMRAQKVFKKALKAGLLEESEIPEKSISEQEVGNDLFRIAAIVQQNGWDAETILRKVIREQEAIYREREKLNS
ncbi:MAG: MazG family protein [Verrucomicrobia bacterium]|nr:MazG family protein [Verrucomicrobiota bacterium]